MLRSCPAALLAQRNIPMVGPRCASSTSHERADLLAQYRHLFVNVLLLALLAAQQVGYLHLALDRMVRPLRLRLVGLSICICRPCRCCCNSLPALRSGAICASMD
jgi:hypothetical protein